MCWGPRDPTTRQMETSGDTTIAFSGVLKFGALQFLNVSYFYFFVSQFWETITKSGARSCKLTAVTTEPN